MKRRKHRKDGRIKRHRLGLQPDGSFIDLDYDELELKGKRKVKIADDQIKDFLESPPFPTQETT